MESGMKIRKLKKKDSLKELTKLSLVFLKGYEKQHKEFFHLKKKFGKAQLEPHFQNSLESREMQTFVAEDKEKIVGFITVEISKRVPFYKVNKKGFISALIVSPEYRRRCVADKLLEGA
ncbi:GNAT family N-acetyltransferase, partial [Candidatus Woesearchaeota archaeon]|nr:GNAT family N-acetyltransferase [Candidatus Woesearchaeota archaeon]